MKKSTGFKGLISLLLVMCLMVSTFGTAYVPTEAAVNKNISIVRIVKYKNSLKVKFKVNKTKKISGYQVQASTSKKFKKAKTKSVKVKSSKRIAKVKKLKKNTKYFVRVRSYTKKKNGKVKYSKWSKVKSAKTLKVNKAGSKGTVDVKSLKQLVPNKLAVDSKGDYYLNFNGWKNWELLFFPDDGGVYHEKFVWSVNCDSENLSLAVNTYLKNLYEAYKALNITNDMSDVEKVMVVCKWVGENVEYAYNSDHTPDSSKAYAEYALSEGKTICGGYAPLKRDLLYLAGVEACVLDVPSRNHAVAGCKLFGYWWSFESVNTAPFNGYLWSESIDDFKKNYNWNAVKESYVCDDAYGLNEIDPKLYAEDSLEQIELNKIGKGTFLMKDEIFIQLYEAIVFAGKHKTKSRAEIIKS